MRTARVIIGANYGDEGKGLMTDYFASEAPEQCVVIRFNGGAQAGHTVVTPEGCRHVFSHFGAGTMAGASTYLSQFFIVNPIMFVKELAELKSLGLNPTVSIQDNALVTTPYDMFINQLLESKRAGARHGSCGLGINETVTRCLRSPSLLIQAKDLLRPHRLAAQLLELRHTWLPARLREFGIEYECEEVASFLSKLEQIVSSFVVDAGTLLDAAAISRQYPTDKHVIFEGAQGLMLDEDRIDQFPHLTRSKTDLSNVLFLARKLELDELAVTYVTRSYLTRHGQGPMPGECDLWFPDQTNVANQFQGRLRFAPLHLEQMQDSIRKDLARARRSFGKVDANLAVTCMDQMDLPAGRLCLPVKYASYGQTRADVKEFAAVSYASVK